MKILAIDTSTKYMSLALADGEKIIVHFHRNLEQRHCARLIPLIDGLLKRSKVKLSDMDCYAISIGPGSFTGLRIGVAAVKGLALATKRPIVKVPTLDAMAYNVKERNGCLVAPIIDARRGNVYASLYSLREGKIRRHFKYSVLPISEFLNHIKGETIFLGDGIASYRDVIEDKLKKRAEFAEEKDWYPKATILASLGLKLFKKGKLEDPDKLTPLYLYPRDVQCRR